jgi:aconitate hydratase
MLNMTDIMETITMIQEENLDIRTITMGISLLDCCDSDIERSCNKVYEKIYRCAKDLVQTGCDIEQKYGIPIINKRISVTPIAMLVGASGGDPLKYALTLDKVAKILQGKKVNPDVSLVISPGSSRILSKLAENGALASMIDAGARIIENACGPCIGMGQSPKSGAVSLRTFNRNFKGRSGTLDADVYLVSPETAAVSAITGVLTDGASSGFTMPEIQPESFSINDNFIVYPEDANKDNTPVEMGPNIKPFPKNTRLPDTLTGEVVLHAGDNITTDDIMPSDSRLLPYRSNIPYLANYCFEKIDPEFAARCKEAKEGVIVGGENYGQGSSREHAALAPLYLGIKFVLAKSFARIHRSNLINSGILPLVFENPSDYDDFKLGDKLLIDNIREQLKNPVIVVKNMNTGKEYKARTNFSEFETEMILAGGKINLINQQQNEEKR